MPDHATAELKEFARRLLACEVASRKPGGAKDSAAFQVVEKLRGPLAKLLGTGGFRALFSRALALANGEVAWLRALHIKADGSLEGLEELEAKLDRDAIARGEVALVAQLLGLLVTFIGLPLTLGLIRGAWPKAAFDDLKF